MSFKNQKKNKATVDKSVLLTISKLECKRRNVRFVMILAALLLLSTLFIFFYNKIFAIYFGCFACLFRIIVVRLFSKKFQKEYQKEYALSNVGKFFSDSIYTNYKKHSGDFLIDSRIIPKGVTTDGGFFKHSVSGAVNKIKTEFSEFSASINLYNKKLFFLHGTVLHFDLSFFVYPNLVFVGNELISDFYSKEDYTESGLISVPLHNSVITEHFMCFTDDADCSDYIIPAEIEKYINELFKMFGDRIALSIYNDQIYLLLQNVFYIKTASISERVTLQNLEMSSEASCKFLFKIIDIVKSI